MTRTPDPTPPASPVAALVVRRRIEAPPEKLFAAWTDPAQLRLWWGPKGVVCTDAQVDLRPGGGYKIANRMPDGTLLLIYGVFEVIEAPARLIYSWQLEGRAVPAERVTVEFVRRGDATDVVVTHELIAAAAARAGHERGWHGCLDGLVRHAEMRANVGLKSAS
jgi:uncharacterized protein YndB with AHSA1/START domain